MATEELTVTQADSGNHHEAAASPGQGMLKMPAQTGAEGHEAPLEESFMDTMPMSTDSVCAERRCAHQWGR
jgi:hypothetical protein